MTGVLFFPRTDLESILFFTNPALNLVGIPRRLWVFIHFENEVNSTDLTSVHTLKTAFIYAYVLVDVQG